MANVTYEKLPLTSPRLVQTAAAAADLDFEGRGALKELSAGGTVQLPRSPSTPVTPRTPRFEKTSLLKRMTGTYQPTSEELEADPLERLKGQDTVRCKHSIIFVIMLTVQLSISSNIYGD
jgi:hypothetical protein